MPDIVDPATRSRMMSGIRAANTRPEMIVRRGLHARGYRYRLHDRRLPGTPDLVFPSRLAVIFVHGCFWHGHDCPLFRWPASRAEFWREKIGRNRTNDGAALERLQRDRWRVCVVWECALRGPGRLGAEAVLDGCVGFLGGGTEFLELRGPKA